MITCIAKQKQLIGECVLITSFQRDPISINFDETTIEQ